MDSLHRTPSCQTQTCQPDRPDRLSDTPVGPGPQTPATVVEPTVAHPSHVARSGGLSARIDPAPRATTGASAPRPSRLCYRSAPLLTVATLTFEFHRLASPPRRGARFFWRLFCAWASLAAARHRAATGGGTDRPAVTRRPYPPRGAPRFTVFWRRFGAAGGGVAGGAASRSRRGWLCSGRRGGGLAGGAL